MAASATAANSMLASTELNYAVGVMPSSDMMVERREVEDWFAKFLRRVVSNTAGPKETLLGGLVEHSVCDLFCDQCICMPMCCC